MDRARISDIAAPTLVVWGEHDRLFPVAYGQAVVDAVPGARFAVIEGAGHNPMWERPGAFNDRILQFLS